MYDKVIYNVISHHEPCQDIYEKFLENCQNSNANHDYIYPTLMLINNSKVKIKPNDWLIARENKILKPGNLVTLYTYLPEKNGICKRLNDMTVSVNGGEKKLLEEITDE